MGYEVKIYFARDYGFPGLKNKEYNCSEVLSMIDMSKMGWDEEVIKFYYLFDTPTPFTIGQYRYGDDDELAYQECIEDCYGSRLRYGDKSALIKQMEKIVKKNDWHMFKHLLDMLKSYEKDDDVKVVLWGY